jgi:nicotinamidase-related amidase
MKRALIVIDVQMEYFTGLMPVTYPVGSFENILAAMDGATAAGMPVIAVQHSAPKESPVFAKDSPGWQLHPEIARRKAVVIEKTLPGSFTGTELENMLRRDRIDTVVIAGYMTQMCCDTTSRQALHLGFGVEFLADATGTLAQKNYAGEVDAKTLHNAVLTVQASRFAKVMPASDWLSGIKK